MRRPTRTGIGAIAALKLMKGLLLAIGSLGLLPLIHGEVATLFSRLLEALHLNAESRLLHRLVLRVDALQPHDILIASLLGLGYAVLLTTEAIGLWYEFAWAAYLVIVSTSLFLPFEARELREGVTPMGLIVLVVNLAIVVYLITQLKRRTLRTRRRSPPARE
jgi:uncharacterized membrane protein (DUF2068 family)